MKRVYATNYTYAEAGPDQLAVAPPALTRRMSWMQKAAMEALQALNNTGFRLPDGAPVYFATQFGEVDATLAVASSILSKALPVSPTAFQHSVHNAVPGYVTIALESRNPSLTVSAGYASLDKLLFWAFHELRHGLIPSALLLNAHERLGPETAACELLVLSTEAPTGVELRAIERAGTRPAWDLLMKSLGQHEQQVFREPAAGAAPAPLRLDRMSGTLHRILMPFSPDSPAAFPFEAFVSTWSVPA